MYWIGSKQRFKSKYKQVIKDILRKETRLPWRFVDAFCGTGTVAEIATTLPQIDRIHVNDMYHRAVGAALARIYPFPQALLDLAQSTYAASHDIVNLTDWARFVMEYSVPVGKRRFFTPENARAIAMATQTVHQILDELDTHATMNEEGFDHQLRLQRQQQEKLRLALMALLCDGVDAISNTTGQYAAYLKTYKKAARNPFKWNLDLLLKPRPRQNYIVTHTIGSVFSAANNGFWNRDEPTLLYLDPPYTYRSYNKLYTIPEILMRGDPTILNTLKGDAGIPEVDLFEPSVFTSKRKALDGFEHLAELAELSHVKAVMLSYSDQGIVPLNSIKQAFAAHQFEGDFEIIPNTRPYKSHHGGNQTTVVQEYIGVFYSTWR